MDQVYLGDSVYARKGYYGEVILTTENGLPTDPSNTIVMEEEVLERLFTVIQTWREVKKNGEREKDEEGPR